MGTIITTDGTEIFSNYWGSLLGQRAAGRVQPWLAAQRRRL